MEPAEKKQKLSVLNIRVDPTELPPWVREASNEDLVKVFKIGVMVRDSIGLNVTFKDKFINDLLTEKLEPMSETIKSLAQNASKETKGMQEQTKRTTENFQKQVDGFELSVTNKVTKMETSLVETVGDVVKKVPPLDAITSKIDNVVKNVSDKVDAATESLKSVAIKLDAMTTMHSKAAIKGAFGEAQVVEILKKLTSHTIEDVATRRDTAKGDILVTSPKLDKYLVEVKKYTGPVPAREIEKFENDVQSSPEFKVGILLSLHSGIAKRAIRRKFQIVRKDNQFLIYVPNLFSDTSLAVWSVLLADELVAINQENLNDGKLAAITALYDEFKSCMEGSKKCKENLENLETAVKNLRENLQPLLKIVSDAKSKLNTVLHK